MANNDEKQLRFKDFYKIAQTLKNLDNESLRQGSGLNGVIVLGQGTLGNIANRLESLADGFQYRLSVYGNPLGVEANTDVEKRYHELNAREEELKSKEEKAQEAQAEAQETQAKYEEWTEALDKRQEQIDRDAADLKQKQQDFENEKEKFEAEKADWANKKSVDPIELNNEQAFDHAEDTRLDSNSALKEMENADDDEKAADDIIDGSVAAEGSGDKGNSSKTSATTDEDVHNAETAETDDNDEKDDSEFENSDEDNSQTDVSDSESSKLDFSDLSDKDSDGDSDEDSNSIDVSGVSLPDGNVSDVFNNADEG